MEGATYPPQQGYYPPPQDQTAYPPQQQNLPQQGYSIQQEYSPQDGDKSQPTHGCSCSAATVFVVQSQPNIPVVAKTVVRRISGDHYLTLSIVLTLLCFFLGTWYSLFCTIPAIMYAISARDAEMRGDIEGAQSKARAALILNIISIVWWVIAIIIIIIAASAAAATGSDGYYAGSYYSSYCYYYTRYRSRYYYYYSYYYRYYYAYYYYSTYTGYRCYK